VAQGGGGVGAAHQKSAAIAYAGVSARGISLASLRRDGSSRRRQLGWRRAARFLARSWRINSMRMAWYAAAHLGGASGIVAARRARSRDRHIASSLGGGISIMSSAQNGVAYRANGIWQHWRHNGGCSITHGA